MPNSFRNARRLRRWLLVVLLLCVVGIVSGCRTFSFYAQAIRGQYQIFANQEDIESLIADPKTPARLREQLSFVEEVRHFASTNLHLPVNGHYSRYVDVHRPYVVWNVQAAPRYSLEPKTWWYPVVGSLEYRGYFTQEGATNYAAYVAGKGYDVSVAGVDAYSTLGWFKDPVLNTFVYHREAELAEIIFHELGHQRVFARGDTDFNEAFATTVGQEGTRRFLRARRDEKAYEDYVASLRRNDSFVRLIMRTRDRLEKLYGDERDDEGRLKAAKRLPAPPATLQREKERIFTELREEYEQLKLEWGGSDEYDAWFARELNNARLNTIANYYDYVPGFERLLELNGGDLEKFYDAVERLSKKTHEERHEWLNAIGAE